MRHNRLFRPRRFRPTTLRRLFRDVTPTARACGFSFGLRIHPSLLEYGLPGMSQDTEGRMLIEYLAQRIEAALEVFGQDQVVSHGKTISLLFGLTLEHRRKSTPQIVRVHVLFGPCDELQTAYATKLR